MNYIKEDGIILKKNIIKKIKEIDTFVFDIDGVLVDVTGSFRVVISKTTQYYFASILKFSGKATLITPEETQLFKLAGGFNNDWDITYAVVLFYLVKSISQGSPNVDEMRNSGENLKKFTESIKKSGGGLKVAKEIALTKLSQREKKELKKLYDKNLIRQIFQEYYGGIDYCQRLYGFEPSYIKQKGLTNREKILVDINFIKDFHKRVGILTGRTREETELILQRMKIDSFISPGYIVYNKSGMRKPHPQTLITLGRKLKTKLGIYFGDTLDDLQTVLNANDKLGERQFLSCIIVPPFREKERDIFRKRKADMICSHINDSLAYIKSVKRKAQSAKLKCKV